MADYAIHDTTLLGIAGIIRKKDGTVAGIDPADFRDRINLMGMLEEATATGAIATFADGADDVPCKNVIAEIPANLSGVSAVTATRSGKNIVDFSGNINASAGGFTFSEVANGGISFSGTSTGTWAYITQKIPCNIPTGTAVTFSRNEVFNVRHYLQITFDDETTRSVIIPDGETSITYTTAKEVTHVRAIMSQLTQGETYAGTVYFQLEVGSAATDYEPFKDPEVYDALLGRTIYGGTVDLVTGEGTESVTFDIWDGSQNYNVSDALTNVFRIYMAHANPLPDPTAVQCICEGYTFPRAGWASDTVSFYSDANNFTLKLPKTEVTTLEEAKAWLAEHNVTFLYYTTPETFTFLGQEIPTILGAQNFWSDAGGDTTVVYRSAGTITPVQPDLITKTITENGTYTASDEGADGYSEVTVNVSGGSGGNTPEASATLICDNSAYASALTFTDDYTNYDVLKIVTYRADAGTELVFYMTPAMLDAMWQYSNNLVNFNQPYTNQFVTYQKTTNTAWTRYGKRNMDIKYVYGLVFTNCTCTETELYNRRGNGSSDVTFTPPTGKTFHDFDYILFSTSTGSNDETEPSLEVFQPNQEKDIFGSDNTREESVIVNKYNSGGKTITVGENTITAHAYFFVAGIELSY